MAQSENKLNAVNAVDFLMKSRRVSMFIKFLDKYSKNKFSQKSRIFKSLTFIVYKCNYSWYYEMLIRGLVNGIYVGCLLLSSDRYCMILLKIMAYYEKE